MNKIKKISQILQIIFKVLLISYPIIAIYGWFFLPLNPDAHMGFHMRFLPLGVPMTIEPSFETRLYGWLINLIPLGIEMFGLYFLIKLFKLYEMGKIFTLKNVKYIRYIAMTLLLQVVTKPFIEAITSFILTFHNSKGKHIIALSFTSQDVDRILTGIIIFLVSWIMAEACKMQDEQVYTI